ncbi:MAG: polysaccharide export protein [Opitutae bacterium]|jgi:polysaccharide export outer membrane protein|nr:polysaccharide export protein [Opitutae bacterium]
MKHLLSSLVLYLLFCIAALSGQDAGASGADSSSSSSPSGAVGMVVGSNYVLKISDVLEIDIYKEPDLNKSVRIEGDGTVSLALVGKVKLAGMTVEEGKSLITDLYNRDYLVDPQISLLVVSFSPKVLHILGSVGRPGVVQIPPDRDLTLTEALSKVGGVTRMGNPKAIKIKRVDQDGRTRQMEVNFSKIVQDSDVKDLVLNEGDTIWVPERII